MTALRFIITHSNSTNERHLCRTEKLYGKLKNIFEEKKYDFNQFVLIDQNHLYVDFTNENNSTSIPSISSEYRIIEKTFLISIILDFQEKQIEYLATTESQLSSIINRFIIDHQLKFTSSNIYLSFFDEFGK
jgi:hypothetical protein